MTHEYGESINAKVIETAVVVALKLRKEAPGVALKVHVDQAILGQLRQCIKLRGARRAVRDAGIFVDVFE